MNYGKRKASLKQKDITSKSGMRKKKIGVRLFKGFLLTILALCIIGCIGGVVIIKRVIDNAPEITPESIKPQGYTSTVLADDGATQTATFVMAGANRVYVTIDEIPKNLQNAFIAIEDSRFYEHNGIDLQGIARAFVVGVTSGNFSEGASTITQQLIKNNVFPDFVNEDTFLDSLERKIQEQYLAIQVEKQLSKEEILESYLNTINLGQNTLGVQAAATRYFNKAVSDLTLSECATIAAITQNPGRYNPVTNPEENAERRQKVLDNMLDQGMIDQAQYDEALADDVYSRIQNVNTEYQNDTSVTSYFNDALASQLMDDMTEKLGYTETQAYNMIYGSGLTIYSTQNTTIQAICDEELNNDSNYPSGILYNLDYALTVTRADGTQENYGSEHIKQFGLDQYGDDEGLLFSSQEQAQARIDAFKASIAQEGDTYDEYMNLAPQPQAAVTVIDQTNGQIKALTGGRGAKTTNRGLNRAYDTTRQAGSCFKILAVYAPALDSAGESLATVRVDEPYQYQSTGQTVHNWWGDTYRGSVTTREAIEQSMNIIAVKTLNDISIDLGFEYAHDKFHLSTLTDEDRVESLALGGITHGVYNYEITAAYAAIANGGVYNEPILYTQVLDHDGNILIDNTTGNSETILKDSTAALLTSAMEDVVTQGTGTPAQLDNMPVAGKTGTTSDNRDLWFCGFTPYYTCSIWTGYDGNQQLSDSEWNYHLIIWANIMNRINSSLGLSYKEFTMPSSLVQRTICTQTGLLAGTGCPSLTEWFAADTAPTTTCSGHYVEPDPEESTGDDSDTGDGSTTGGTTGDTTGDSTGSNDTGGGNTGDNTGGNTGGGDNTGGGNTGGGDTGGGDTGGGTGETPPAQ